MAHTTGYDAQSHSREDVGVVSLAGVKGPAVRQHHLIKGTSTGKNAPALAAEEDRNICTHSCKHLCGPQLLQLYLCEGVALLCRALRLTGGVAQSKDDGPLIEGRHVSDDLLRKCTSNRSHSCKHSSRIRQRSHSNHPNSGEDRAFLSFLGFRLLITHEVGVQKNLTYCESVKDKLTVNYGFV